MRITYGEHEPQIDETAWIAPSATVIGQVRIGAESSIWYGSVLRADNDLITIGSQCNIQDGCVLHTDRGLHLSLGEGVSVGHRAVVHGCTVEDDVLIGMGAVVMNRARIGTESLVAAGSVVPEGAVIAPRSLVAGVPGKVRRGLSDAEVDRIREIARGYQAKIAEHARAVANAGK